jgi:hypothetical protein
VKLRFLRRGAGLPRLATLVRDRQAASEVRRKEQEWIVGSWHVKGKSAAKMRGMSRWTWILRDTAPGPGIQYGAHVLQ